MKRVIAVLLCSFILVGCHSHDALMDRAVSHRNQLLSGDGCSFQATVTADYGEKLYTFSMDCTADKEGNLRFCVTDPDSISGISGVIQDDKGHLTFDESMLTFEMLADGQVTPVTAPWLLIRTLRSGYFAACGKDGELLRLSVDDSYAEDTLRADVWLGEGDLPVYGEFLWKGRRILSLQISHFQIL